MNIIKIKDILLDETNPIASKFNEHFKGKYVYLINGYCCPLDAYDPETLMALDTEMYRYPQHDYSELIDQCLTLEQLGDYIDQTNTSKVNDSIHRKYQMYNDFVPSDITEEQVKKFRTWLATTLLTFDIEDPDVIHMLTYYAGGMYDDVVEALRKFGGYTYDPLVQIKTTTCGCQNNTGINLFGNNVLTCDSLMIYRKNIYLMMVKTFSEMNFWTDFDVEFLQEFKLYIDNVLKMGLPLYTVGYEDTFADCTCQINENTLQRNNRQILINLSQSLQYLIDEDITGHKVFITNSFADWSKYLYEMMEW